MKKWLYLAAVLTAAGVLSRLPHPARDISSLKPVRAVFVYMEENDLHIETDTGDRGSGKNLSEAAADMKARADGEIFLETAEFLLLSAQVRITEDFYALLRPSCRVICTGDHPDLKEAAEFLSAHPPEITLAHLRAVSARHGSERSRHANSKTANTLAPGRDPCAPGPRNWLRLAHDRCSSTGDPAPVHDPKRLEGPAETPCPDADPVAWDPGGRIFAEQPGLLAV